MKSKTSGVFIVIAFAVFDGLAPLAWGQALPGQGALPPLIAEALARHPQVRMQQALASAAENARRLKDAGANYDALRRRYGAGNE